MIAMKILFFFYFMHFLFWFNYLFRSFFFKFQVGSKFSLSSLNEERMLLNKIISDVCPSDDWKKYDHITTENNDNTSFFVVEMTDKIQSHLEQIKNSSDWEIYYSVDRVQNPEVTAEKDPSKKKVETEKNIKTNNNSSKSKSNQKKKR